MNPDQMGLLQQANPAQQPMDPMQAAPEQGMPMPGGPPPMEPPMGGGLEPGMEEDMEEDMEEGEDDPELQKQYQEAYYALSMLMDEKKTFDATRGMLDQASENEMLPEIFGQMMSSVIQRVERDTGPLEFEVVTALFEHLIEEAEDRWGVKIKKEEEVMRAGAAGFSLYFQAHPDRVPYSQEEVEAELGEED